MGRQISTEPIMNTVSALETSVKSFGLVKLICHTLILMIFIYSFCKQITQIYISDVSGNGILYNLTSVGPMSLRVDMQYGNDTVYAHYANFSIDSKDRHYTLTVSGYTGTAGDHFIQAPQMPCGRNKAEQCVQ